MKKNAPALSVMAFLAFLLLFVACQEPGYRIAFENNGKFTDWIDLQVIPGNAHLRVVGWGDFVNDEYELRLVFQIEKGSGIGDLELHLDSLRVTYNNTAMDVIESESMNGDHLITQRKEIFNVAYHTPALWELLPRDEKGVAIDVRITISMNDVLQLNGQTCRLGTLVAWERKAARYSPTR